MALSRASLERSWGRSPWLVVVPHDDDLVLGSGLVLALAAELGIAIHVAVCTDGALGYADVASRGDIVAIRRDEMASAVQALGLDVRRLQWLQFPDGSLSTRLGARPAGEPPGLGQTLARLMRAIDPGVVFSCHEADVHPDHRAVAMDTAIASFWASSDIWRELGEPIETPRHVQYGVYAAFTGSPDWKITGTEKSQARKLEALAAFRSQSVIDGLVARVEAAGPVEFFRDATQPPHGPETYAHAFSTGPDPGEPTDLRHDLDTVAPLLERWPARPWPPLVSALGEADERSLWLLGEGSSVAFPGHYCAWLARHWGGDTRIVVAGGREAAQHGVPPEQRCFLSNSGHTRELAELDGGAALLITGADAAPLAAHAQHVLTLLPEPERAVAATVSVLAQALTLAHALADTTGRTLPIAELRAALGDLPRWSEADVDAVAQCTHLWWVDPGHHLADELALKTVEIVGVPAQASQGTALLHGPVEVLGPDDGIVWLDPPKEDTAHIHHELRQRAGATLLCVREPSLGPWTPLLRLVQGWQLLLRIAQRRGRNPDAPRRARKVGNPI